MRKGKLERKLEEVARLREEGPSASAWVALERVLEKGPGLVVAKAAHLAAEWEASELGGGLVAAFDRLILGGYDLDAQCWGKVALLKALRQLEWPDYRVYARGCRVRQMEPVWGGREDSAASLRVLAFQGLADCLSAPEQVVLEALTDLLADPVGLVRADVARAAPSTGYLAAAYPLRLKVRLGEEDPRVLGACFDSLLALQRSDAVGFVAEYARTEKPEVRAEALTALAAADLEEAVNVAREAWSQLSDPRLKKTLLLAFGSSPVASAHAFLLEVLAEAPLPLAAQALEALRPRADAETRRAIGDKVEARGEERLLEAFLQQFG